MTAIEKVDIRRLEKEKLKTILQTNFGMPAYRSDQIWKWLWQKGAASFEAMSDLPKTLRESLGQAYEIRQIKLDEKQISGDGTIKFRFRLHDQHYIEAVLIPVPEENRFTVCVSSQVGCSLSCTFCATGQMKRMRNLEAGEIFDQVYQVNLQSLKHFKHPLTNIVFMGMGEPLLNFRNMMEAINHITSPEGLAMSAKRITVSTAGIVKMIRRLAEMKVRFNLALSLHAANDEKRNKIMPINKQNDLASLKEALRLFFKRTRNKVTLEYIAFQKFNDSIEDADQLAKFCDAFPVMINIIEYNPVEGVQFIKSEMDRIDRFALQLRKHKIAVTVRKSRGKDIDAACGQLANKGVIGSQSLNR